MSARRTHKQKRHARSSSLLMRTGLHQRLPMFGLVVLLVVVAAGKALFFSGMHAASGGREALRAEDVWLLHGAADFSLADYRQAARLSERLHARHSASPAPDVLARALVTRRALLARSLPVTIQDEAGLRPPVTFTVQPTLSWFHLEQRWGDAQWSIDTDTVRSTLERVAADAEGIARVPVLAEHVADGEVQRAQGSGIARAGFVPDWEQVAEHIASSLLRDEPGDLMVIGSYVEASIARKRDDSPPLTLIASGISDFGHSPAARAFNVEKAMHERVHGIVIPAGETFSFNATLGGPVTLDKGWQEALGLFGGGSALTPGGGICQAATTVYRAALLAGLPIVERRSHSLYVTYYERGGVGIDATIFPGVHDLQFKNDTGHELLIQSYTHGTGAVVNIFGIDDGRDVTLEGPFFASSPGKPGELPPLTWRDIGWLRTVRHADGREERHPFVSRYLTGFPRSVIANHPVTMVHRNAKAAAVAAEVR